jgi:hypothetical protein
MKSTNEEEDKVLSPDPVDVMDEDKDSHTLFMETSDEKKSPSEPRSFNHMDATSTVGMKPKISKSNLPEFLPAEYLEDDPIEASTTLENSTQLTSNRPKKTKFVDPTPKRPKDRTKGSVTYRVAEARGDGLLAPKAANNARSVKEAWLKGRISSGGIRKSPNAGFFVNRR